MWQWGLDRIGGFDVDGDLCFKEYAGKEAETPAAPLIPEQTGLAVGDIVRCKGGYQYGASTADIGYPAKAGLVRITIKADGAPHPYHVISEDGSGVYGWVDGGILSPKGGEKEPESRIKVGDTVMLKKGAKTYDGVSLASFVYDRPHTVSELVGDRAVINYGDVVIAAVKSSDLTLLM